ANYAGTIHFTSSDAFASLPPNYPFAVGDAGVHTFTGGATLYAAGSRTISVNDTVATGAVGTSNAIVVTSTATTTVISRTPNSHASTYGDSLALTATVSGPGGTPTGTVQWKVDGSNYGSPVGLVGGQ